MKQNAKRVFVVLAVVLALLLAGCGGGGGFRLEGKWKNVGAYTFGQVQSGAIVVFDGKNCNVFSPKDTYAFYKDGSDYKLECTSLLFSETLTFRVKIVDKDHINIYYGSNYLEMSRVG